MNRYEGDSTNKRLMTDRWIENDSATIHNSPPSAARARYTADSWQNWNSHRQTKCVEKNQGYIYKQYKCNS